MSARTIALVVLGPRAMVLARRAQATLPGALIHGPQEADWGADAPDLRYDKLALYLRALFAEGQAIIGLCAAGILIRALAPLLADKASEPPVLALAEDGAALVPLLGGHQGANALARKLGAALGLAPAITTAGDARLGLALDEPPPGWRLGAGSDIKGVTSALLDGKPIALEGAASAAPWLHQANLSFAPQGVHRIVITDHARPPNENEIVYHPALLALGVGCVRGASADEIAALITETLDGAGLAPASVAGLFTIAQKANEPGLREAAARFNLPFRYFLAEQLEAEHGRLSQSSDAVFAAVGAHGVAEAAALAAASEGGLLIVPKRKSARVTCAIARAPAPIDAAKTGRGLGRLLIIGLGPGAAHARTLEATAALAAAEELIGYSGYLEQLGPLAHGKTLHGFPLGAEEARVRKALERAAKGRTVALVSSGDAGIYGMASLVFEQLANTAEPAWRAIEPIVIPGVSALQLAAARAGAPLGHDFCAISLSDLLTTWETIAARLEAAARADFVIALYNPASNRRREPLRRALVILRSHRAADCPVVVARELSRSDESVIITTLGSLDERLIDMRTILLIGAPETRAFVAADGRHRVFTPRGYARKEPGAA